VASYPSTLPIDPKESRRIVRDGRREDSIGDGAMRVRKLHVTRYDFEIKHPALTSAEFSTWQTFYNTNENGNVELTWPEDGVVYNLRFGAAAFRTQWTSPTRRHVWVRLVDRG